jgi:hypothetical protein
MPKLLLPMFKGTMPKDFRLTGGAPSLANISANFLQNSKLP